MDDVHVRAPVARHSRITSAIAGLLGGRRPRREVRRVAPRIGGRERVRRVDRPGDLGVDQQRRAEAGARIAIAGASSTSPTQPNSATPESTRKHLKPSTPSATRPASSPALPGTTPPQNPTSTAHWPVAAARLAANASRVVVGGIELSGMSTSVVTPPIAAARRRGREALPLGAAGLVQVNVGVDDTGQHRELADVIEPRPGGDVVPRGDALDLTGADMDRGRADRVGHDASRAHDEERLGHRRAV